MGLPFQMIFSIILIAVFLYAAFTGIKYFMERSDQAQILQFVTGFEAKVETIWRATEAQQPVVLDLPKRIEKVCISDFSNPIPEAACPGVEIYREQFLSEGSNMFLCPPKKALSVGVKINYAIDCSGNDCLEIKKGDLFCLPNQDGKVSFTLKKDLGNPKVVLEA